MPSQQAMPPAQSSLPLLCSAGLGTISILPCHLLSHARSPGWLCSCMTPLPSHQIYPMLSQFRHQHVWNTFALEAVFWFRVGKTLQQGSNGCQLPHIPTYRSWPSTTRSNVRGKTLFSKALLNSEHGDGCIDVPGGWGRSLSWTTCRC